MPQTLFIHSARALLIYLLYKQCEILFLARYGNIYCSSFIHKILKLQQTAHRVPELQWTKLQKITASGSHLRWDNNTITTENNI